MSSESQSLLKALHREVRRCHPVALRYFKSGRLRIERKVDRSPVTAADRAVEELLRKAIRRLCPGERIVGEEFGGSAGGASAYWTVDPIDGTRAFSRGLPTWCIMVGRVQRGRPTLGICDFPAINTTIAVAPGVKAYERCGSRTNLLSRPKPVGRLDEVSLFHGGAGWWEQSPYAKGFRRLIGKVFLERAFGDCYGYLWALRGCADVVIEYGVKIWDMVPLAAIACATGRVMIDVQGHPSWTGPDTIMAAPSLAKKVAAILRKRS